MSVSNRAARITKLNTLLKKKYKPTPNVGGRTLFEQFLYACLLEDASQDVADEGIAKLEQEYFDWNEVRVTTVQELSEVLSSLPDPMNAATRLKKNLHALFETYYKFDIEELKKQNLGKTMKELSEFPAMTPFVLSYLVQHGLGGHAIPFNSTGLNIFYYCGIITEAERKSKKVPGVERAIPKSKGVEFASILHQFALDFAAKPKDTELQDLIIKINPEAVPLLPGAKKTKPKAAPKKKNPTSKTASKTSAKSATQSETKKKSTSKEKPAKATKSKAVKKKTSPAKSAKTATPAPVKKKKASKNTTKRLTKKKPR